MTTGPLPGHRRRLVLLALQTGLASLMLTACAGAGHRSSDPLRFDPQKRPTILVLSVGGPEGVAHLGAISAVKEANLPLAAVVGNSAGALVGALYASAPDEDTALRLEILLHEYQRATHRDQLRNGVALGLIAGAVAAVLTEGDLWPTLGGAAGGLAVGALATAVLDRDRLVDALRVCLKRAKIEDTPIRFVTFHAIPGDAGLKIVSVAQGDLASAVGGSLSNPLLFSDVEIRQGEPLDPGGDRVAAVPVEDACRLFPDTNILAINVTDEPALYSKAMTCPLLEVRLARRDLTAKDMLAPGDKARKAIAAAAAQTRLVLGAALGVVQ